MKFLATVAFLALAYTSSALKIATHDQAPTIRPKEDPKKDTPAPAAQAKKEEPKKSDAAKKD